MKNAETIIEEMKSQGDSTNQRSSTAGLIKAITLDVKNFFADLFSNSVSKLSMNKFDVEVKNPLKLPDVFKIDGSVTLKDTKALLIGLNEIVRGIEATKKHYETQTKQLEKSLKPEKVDFTKLEKAINSISIPEPLESTFVTNFPDYNKKLDLIQKEISKLKLDPKINVSPTKVSIDLEGVKNQLQAILDALATPEKYDEPTGYSWTKDSDGNLSSFTETYKDKKIVSSGWNLGSVKIEKR